MGRGLDRLVYVSMARSGDGRVSETGSPCKRAAAQDGYVLRVAITLTYLVAIVALASRVSAASALVSNVPTTHPKSSVDVRQNEHCDDDSDSADDKDDKADDQSDDDKATANPSTANQDQPFAAKPDESADADSAQDASADKGRDGAEAKSDSGDDDGDCSDDDGADDDDKNDSKDEDVERDDRPTLLSRFDYYSDSDHNVNLTTTSIATAPFHGFMISLRRDWVQAEAPSEVQATEITTVAFSKDFSERWGIGGGFGNARAMRSNDLVGSFAAHFNYAGASITASIAREMLMESARTTAANIRQTDFGLSFSDELSEHVSTDAEAHHHIYTDGNSSNDFALSPQYTFNLAGSKLEVGYRFSYTGFAHSAQSGYWAPQSALSNGISSALTFDRAWIYGHSELGFNYDLARESGPLSNGPSSGPGASAAFALGIRPIRGIELETYWTGTGSAGWNSMNLGLSLKYIF
jgi:hypothetical protein